MAERGIYFNGSATVQHVRFKASPLLLLSMLLVGNGEISGLDLFFFALLPGLLFAETLGGLSHFLPHTLAALLGSSAIFLSLALRNLAIEPFGNAAAFALWPAKAFLTAAALIIVNWRDWSRAQHAVFAAACLGLLANADYIDGRMYSLFGPNMLYRVFGCLFVLSAWLYFKGERGNLDWLVLCSGILGALGCILTGSSTALLMLLIPLVLIAGLSLRTAVNLLLAAALVLICLFLFRDDLVVFARLSSKFASIESAHRVLGWIYILQSEFSWSGRNYDFFTPIWIGGHRYPHNIIFELYAYYGAVGIVVSSCVVLTAVFGRKALGWLYLPYLVSFVGAQFSGDLSENYAVVGLSAYHWATSVGALSRKAGRACERDPVASRG